MKSNNEAAFLALKDYLASCAPFLGDIAIHIADPYATKKTQSVLLPDAMRPGQLDVALYTSVVNNNADLIELETLKITDLLNLALAGLHVPDIIKAEITRADIFAPNPQAHNVGILSVLITLITDYGDDCS